MKFEMRNPTPEEIKKAEKMMTPEQKAALEQREKEFYSGEEFEGGVESRVRKWGENVILKEFKPIEKAGLLEIPVDTEKYLKQKENDYKELKSVFGDYLLDTDFFRSPSKENPEKITNYAAQRKMEGQTLAELRLQQEKYLADPNFRNQAAEIIWLTKKAFTEKGLLIDINAENIMRETKSGRLFVIDPGSPSLARQSLKSPAPKIRHTAESYFQEKIKTLDRWENILNLRDEEKKELNSKFGINDELYKKGIEENRAFNINNDG